jgi:uncharacterized protein YbjT (DUF2867 family)
LNVDSMRDVLSRIRTLFLLNAVTPDELTQALITLNLAREAGIERVVYFSVIHSDKYVDVPHFSGKFAVERMLGHLRMPATILRPAYFMQNDAALRDAILGHGVYPMPIGGRGISMVDTRDLAEVAALKLLERENAASPLPGEVLDVAGPDTFTGDAIAALWGDVLKKQVHYAGDDIAAFEQRLKAFLPSWMAYDLRVMMSRFHSDGMKPALGDSERLTTLLGRPLRTYRQFAIETAKQWQA